MTTDVRWSGQTLSIDMSDGKYPGIEGVKNAYVIRIYLSPKNEVLTGTRTGFTEADVQEGANVLRRRLGLKVVP